MTENKPFQKALRSEYDPELLDASQRSRKADRLHRALKAAGLWQGNAHVLDVGSGTGLLLAGLGNDVQLRVGCDLRTELFLRVRQQIIDVKFVQADGGILPFPTQHFGMVTCLAVIGEFPDWQAALREMGRCVVPNGVLYVSIANGRLLLWVYSLARRFGIQARESWWSYARACARMSGWKPEEGMGTLNMQEWRFVDVTPYLTLSKWPQLGLVPMPILRWLARHLAPGFGYAWRRV